MLSEHEENSVPFWDDIADIWKKRGHDRDRPDEFNKRLNNLIEKSASGKQFGYHIEDLY